MKAMGILLLLSLALFCFSAHLPGVDRDCQQVLGKRISPALPRYRRVHVSCRPDTSVSRVACKDKDKDKPDCSEFKDSGTFCTRESNPHCGDDGMTYGNLCAFCKAVEKSGGKLRLYHMGKC
ncbi:serine protease inhibitor Kazal-type 6-like isoform X2 [Alligator sinensis]|uniref:Serine protease inhibitor Kazal-type 6-like isoform X2 n=1 Tax=Alligator sinensis TaxID=38654 RepID=A0A1U7RZX3_ALLSI|nr:serine protease inhibitor Kazal-type 6-like isoform X2 [Alligator sinensis]